MNGACGLVGFWFGDVIDFAFACRFGFSSGVFSAGVLRIGVLGVLRGF